LASTPDGLLLIVLFGFSAVIKKVLQICRDEKKVSPKFVSSVIFFQSYKSRQIFRFAKIFFDATEVFSKKGHSRSLFQFIFVFSEKL